MLYPIGQDVETEKDVEIDDTTRQSGLYILGKPGMGKSNLIETLVLSDIEDGYGMFFLDPHGDAIDNIVKYLKPSRQRIVYIPLEDRKSPDYLKTCFHGLPDYRLIEENTPVKILNPENEEYSFGINPLSCRDLTSLKERTDTYTRAYNIFYKIWEEDWGVWLQLIVQNTLYVFLENPEYTLTDVPLFYTNENFRHYLVNNVKYNLDVKDFWLTRFESKRDYDQQRQVDAALTRISILLGHPYIKHIIGQTKTKVDFSRILAGADVIFLKLSAGLAPDIKKFIGMIVIGELLHHVRRRPPDGRLQFCVYIDEFQNFSTSDDLATFITEARKFGIATTIAHQERFGQLGDNKKMQGATLAAANKIYFQLTIKDAEELAGDFTREPPTETRLEEQYVISQNPVYDLMQKGHTNPEIRDFTNKFLQTARDQISDIDKKADYKKLERQGYADEANLLRLTSQEEGVDYRRSDIKAMRRALDASGSAMISAIRKTESLKSLNEDAEHLRHLLRKVNELFVQVMEGKTAQGQESFSEALISIFRHTYMSYETRKIMEFIISYFYGDNTHFKRSIPYVLAKGADLYPKECALFESEQKKGDLKIIYEPLPPRLLKLTGYEYLRLMVVIKAFRDLPTQDSIRRLVRICELLAIPQNHILVKSGQLIKKQIYTRTASDMKAEMAHELASLSRYIAWVKKVDDSNMVVKNKIRTFSVAERFEYNMDYMEILQRVIRETRELYCTRRDLIEEEIIKRQARWRGGVQSPPAEQAASQEVIGSSSKPKPPPSNIPSQTTPATQEPQEEKNLIYRSNFYLPDDKWTEGNIDGVRQFRRDGYYHIEINELYASIEPLKIPISDFKVCVDAEILKYVTSATCGICFRCIKEGDKHSYYLFAFSLKSYDLFLFRNGEYKFLTDYPPANFSGFKNINSLMVQMVGQEITLEMNGHILGTITDNNLILPGYIGLFVSKKENSPLEVRFRNFRLYSLE